MNTFNLCEHFKFTYSFIKSKNIKKLNILEFFLIKKFVGIFKTFHSLKSENNYIVENKKLICI